MASKPSKPNTTSPARAPMTVNQRMTGHEMPTHTQAKHVSHGDRKTGNKGGKSGAK